MKRSCSSIADGISSGRCASSVQLIRMVGQRQEQGADHVRTWSQSPRPCSSTANNDEFAVAEPPVLGMRGELSENGGVRQSSRCRAGRVKSARNRRISGDALHQRGQSGHRDRLTSVMRIAWLHKRRKASSSPSRDAENVGDRAHRHRGGHGGDDVRACFVPAARRPPPGRFARSSRAPELQRAAGHARRQLLAHPGVGRLIGGGQKGRRHPGRMVTPRALDSTSWLRAAAWTSEYRLRM